MKKIFLILCIAVSVAACKNEEPESIDSMTERFLNHSTPGAYVEGHATFQFDDNIHQTSLNEIRRTYRIQTDAMDKFMNCTLSEYPALENEFDMGVDTKGISGMSMNSYKVRVLSIRDGYCWLWNDERKTGFIVPSFE